MNLRERLAALKAEHSAALEEAESFKRLAESRQRELTKVQRPSTGNGGFTTPLVEQRVREMALLRDRADSASERARELSEQIAEIQNRLHEAESGIHAPWLNQWSAIRQRLDEIRNRNDLTPIEREAEEQSLLRQMRNVRAQVLKDKGEALVNDYLAAARHLIQVGTELKAFADIATLFGLRLSLSVEDLFIPTPRGGLSTMGTRQAEDALRIDKHAVLTAKSAFTAAWADWLSD